MRVRECGHDDATPGAAFCRSCGQKLTNLDVEINGRAVAPAASELEGGRRGRWSRKRRAWTAAAVALVLGLGIAFYEIQDAWYGPEEPVEALISAMEDGDGPAVAAMIADSAARSDLKDDAKDSPLLRAGALDTGYRPPTDMRVTGVEYGGSGDDRTQREDRDGAEVSVSYTLGGKQRSATVRVQRENSGVFRSWELWPDALLTNISVDVWHTASGKYAIAGVHTKAASLVGLPGSYTVTADPDGLYDRTTDHVAVPIGDDRSVSIDKPRPKKTTTAEAEKQVRGFIDKCASGGPPANECNFNDDAARSGYVPEKTQWSIDSYPEIELRPYKARAPEQLTNGEAKDYGILMVVTKKAGKAIGKYENILDDAETITAAIEVTGMVTIGDDGKPEFSATTCPPNQKMCLLRGQ